MATQEQIGETATEVATSLAGLDDDEKVAAVVRAGVVLPSVGDMPDAFWSNMSSGYKTIVFLGSTLILAVLLGVLLMVGVDVIRDATKTPAATNDALLGAGNMILAAGIGLLGAGIGGGAVAVKNK